MLPAIVKIGVGADSKKFGSVKLFLAVFGVLFLCFESNRLRLWSRFVLPKKNSSNQFSLFLMLSCFSCLEDYQGLVASCRGQEDPVPHQGHHGRVRGRPEPVRGIAKLCLINNVVNPEPAGFRTFS